MDNESHTPTALGQLLQRLRNEAGITMAELARRSGINRSTLLRIEAGAVSQPGKPNLNAMARALGVEPEQLYDAIWQENEAPLPSPAVYFRSKYRLNPQQIAQMEESLKAITEEQPNMDQKERR